TGAAARTITIGNVSSTTGLVLNSGTGGVAINTTTTGDVIVTSADTVLIDSAGVLELNSSAGVIGIGNDAVAQNINIGTGAAARTITMGNISGATAVNVNSGTGGFNVVSTGAGDITLASSDTVLIDSAGVLELNSSAGVISVGNDAVAQNINIGTGAAARTITIGNVSSTTGLVLNSGTGCVAINTTTTGDVIVASADTLLLDSAGVLELNSSAGVISVGNDAVSQNINIGTAGARVISIGNSTGATQLVLDAGTGGVDVGTNAIAHTVTLGNIIGASAVNINSGTAGSAIVTTNGTFSVATGTGTVDISNDATANTVNVGTGAGVKTVNIGSTNTTSVTTINAGATGNVALGGAFVALPGPVFIYTGAGAPAGGLAVQVGDLYINTTAASAVTRMYIATAAGVWTNFTCAA